jgi:hypothetical protein
LHVLFPIHVGCAGQSVTDAWTDIFRSDVSLEFGLLHELRGLFSCTAQQQRSTGLVNLIGEIPNSTETGRIDRGHITQTEDNNRWQGVQAVQDIGELIGGSEQERTVDAIYRRILRNVPALQDVRAPVLDIISRHPRDGGGSLYFADEHQRRQNHANLDRERKIRDNCKS